MIELLLIATAALLLSGSGSGIGAIKKSRFLPVYIDNKVNPALQLSARPGVYILKQAGQIVYVGYSASNIYKTMLRHFQSWEDIQTRVTYPRRNEMTARIVYCSPSQAARLERALIVKHNPRDNSNKYDSYQLQPADSKIIEQYEEAPF